MTSPDTNQARIPDGCQSVKVEALQHELDLRSWTYADLAKATGSDGERPLGRDTIGDVMKSGIANRRTMLRITAALVANPPPDVAERLVG